jgi:hypothetical protein
MKRQKANRNLRQWSESLGLMFIDLFPGHLPSTFLDLSPLTPHLRYVPCLRLLTNYLQLNINELNLQAEEKRYEDEKW